MTSVERIESGKPFAEQLAAASPDLLRDMLGAFIASVMSAEADAACGGTDDSSLGEAEDPREFRRINRGQLDVLDRAILQLREPLSRASERTTLAD